MKKKMTLLGAMLALVLGGCGDSHESLMSEQLSVVKKMVATLEGIKDEDSANAAKATLESYGKQLKDIQQRADKMPKPTADEEKALKGKFESDFNATMQKFLTEMMRVGFDPKIGPILKDIDMKGMGN